MSSSGINAINSGPLIIRSYFGSSINNTYALGDNDIPISSNRVLVTSTNGLVTPSDNIYVSSITISSINGLPYAPGGDVFWSSTSSNGSIVNDNTGSVQINTFLQCSTITDVSTINGLPYPPQDDVFWASTLNGDIVNTNTGIVNISTGLIVNNSFSTLTIFDNIGLPGTTGQVLTAGPSGAQVIWSNTLNVLSISTTSISATSISTSTINGLPYPPQNDTFWASTLSGDIINTNTGNVNISTALNVDGSILTSTSYTLYNVASTYGTLSITPSTAAGFPGNGYINCDFLTFRTANSGGAFLSLNTNTSMMNVQGTLSTLSIRDNNGSTGTSGYVLTAGTGGQVIWSTISGLPAPGLLTQLGTFDPTGALLTSTPFLCPADGWYLISADVFADGASQSWTVGLSAFSYYVLRNGSPDNQSIMTQLSQLPGGVLYRPQSMRYYNSSDAITPAVDFYSSPNLGLGGGITMYIQQMFS